MRKIQQSHEFLQLMEKESDSILRSILTRYITKPAPKNQYNGMKTNGAKIDKN
jgi:hypothetical protein